MKILHVMSSFNPLTGGPSEGVRQFAGAAEERSHTVEIVCLDTPDAPFIKESQYAIHALGPATLRYGFCSRLYPWLREHAGEYDAVIVNGIWQYHGLTTWRALRDSTVPYVVFTHGMLDPWFKRMYPLKHLKKLAYWTLAERRILGESHAVIFTCEEERLLARQSFPNYNVREVVVGYGTSTPPGDSEAQRDLFLKAFPNLKGKRVALFIGRIHPKKACDILLQAYASVLKNEKDWMLVMAGPDQVGWQGQLTSLASELGISDQIVWTGMITGDMKWGALRASEFMILPSHQENFGIVVAEALACGVPVLISKKVNIWREVRSSNAGLTENDDLDGTRTMLEQWIQMPKSERAAMKRNAVACFHANFEIRSAADRLIQLLQDASTPKGAAA